MYSKLFVLAALTAGAFAQASASAILTAQQPQSTSIGQNVLSSIGLSSSSGDALFSSSSSSSNSRSSRMATSTRGNAQSGTTVISGWLGVSTGAVASVLAAGPCDTTIVATCTDEFACPSIVGVPLTYTQGPFDYQYSFSTSTFGAEVSVSEYCSLFGPATAPTQAVCTVTASASARGTSSQTTSVSTITGASLSQDQVTITAGADKLASITGSCTAAPTHNAAPAANSVHKAAGIGAFALAGFVLL